MRTWLWSATAVVGSFLIPARAWAQDTTQVVKHLPTFVAPTAKLAQLPRRPSVVDSTYAAAAGILTKLGITVVARGATDSTARPGIVLRQSPPAGTVIRPSAVDTLYVARPKGGGFVSVPDVVGQPYVQAADRIRSIGLVPVGPALSPVDSGRARVDSQSPTPPRLLPAGYRVTLSVQIDTRTPLPELIGNDTARARIILRRAGLRLGPPTLVFDDHYGPGFVIHQVPEAGALVERGTAVVVRVSRGPHPETTIVVVPPLIGLTLDRATARLEDARLKLAHADTAAVDKGAGLVVHQQPHAGDTLHFGDAVAVTIGVPRTAVVPSLIGLSRDSAAATLASAGLVLGVVRVVVSSKRDSGVVAQSLPPGARAAPGSAIAIDVNEPPLPKRVAVPEVRKLRYADAVAILIDSGLSADSPTYKPEGPAGVVLDQRPAARTLVVPGSSVALEVGGRPPPPPPPDSTVVMPAVVDSPVSAALRRLDRAGLRNVIVDSKPTPLTAVAWLTEAQAPDAGELVLPSTVVRLRARPVQKIARVPKLLGMTELAARIEAEGEGFRLSVIGRTRSLRFGDAVVASQAPAPFEAVAPGTTLAITIAEPVPPVVVTGAALLAGVVVAALLYLGLRTPLPDHAAPTPPPAVPSFRTTIRGDLPSVAAGSGGPLVQADVTFRVERGLGQIEVTSTQADFVQSDRIVPGDTSYD